MGRAMLAFYVALAIVCAATGNGWAFVLAGLATLAALMGALCEAVRLEAGHDAGDDVTNGFRGSFRGHGASDE